MRLPKKLSIIIPVYNESARVNAGLAIIKQWHQRQPDWEFILVNDGSTDNTAAQINKFKFIKLISYSNNQGKGFALKQGVRKATKPLVLLSDIDFSTPLTELNKFLQLNTDIVIGSRKTEGSQITKRQPALREWLGKQFTNLTNLWLGLKISDITCGFKLFKNPVAKKLFGLSKIKRWGYDAEILFLAKKLNYKIKEMPVIWKNDINTKVNLVTDIFRSLVDLIRIRF